MESISLKNMRIAEFRSYIYTLIKSQELNEDSKIQLEKINTQLRRNELSLKIAQVLVINILKNEDTGDRN